MTDTKQTAKQTIQENIKRLEYTASQNFWNKVYVANCKKTIEAYKHQLQNL